MRNATPRVDRAKSKDLTPPDLNGVAAALLHDLAWLQTSKPQQFGYKRAAAAIQSLDRPIDMLRRADGTLEKIPFVGPSSQRIILEVLEQGDSPTVHRLVAESPKRADVERRRALRGGFLSRAAVLTALANPNLRGPALTDYQGDLQMHSTWSDGSEPLDALIEGCLARGYRYCAVTDHSYGLPIARGVSMADLARQHAEIDRLNRRYAGRFRMIKSIEANILTDGTVDMTEAERRTLELVVAAPHSKLRGAEDQTARLLAAIATPGVAVLAHPRGRMYGSRPGVAADWDRVFAAAAARRVAIEIDGDPARQDLDYTLARRAAAAGCLLALDSDAHSSRELRYAETAVAHARLAGVDPAQVVNCWPLPQLLDWAAGAWRA
jgi:histidinol phosphatase-like PHP family hydrolase